MRLEQTLEMYQPRVAQEERQQTYFVVRDLESLSASALYTPKIQAPKAGMTLPGGLTIKKIGKNTLTLSQDYGLLRDLYTLHPDGHGAKREIALTKKSKLIDKKSW